MAFKAYLEPLRSYFKSCAFVISIYMLSVIIWGISFVVYSSDVDKKTIFDILSYVFIVDTPILMLSIISVPVSLIIEFVACSETSYINSKGIFIALLLIMLALFFMFLGYKTQELYEGIHIYLSIGLILLLTAYIKFMFVQSSKTISPIFTRVTT